MTDGISVQSDTRHGLVLHGHYNALSLFQNSTLTSEDDAETILGPLKNAMLPILPTEAPTAEDHIRSLSGNGGPNRNRRPQRRQGKPSEEQIRWLDQLGFAWSSQLQNAAWEKRF
ncbi:MAG: hypothetical protein ABSH20_32200, partial [Tepidisphaeraceae bacterium]